MQNLINFIIRFHAVFLFIILEIGCLSLVGINSQYHRTGLNNTVSTAFGSYYKLTHSFKDYLNLYEANQELLRQNANLQTATPENLIIGLHEFEQLDSTNNMQKIPIDSLKRFQYIPANVIHNSVSASRNFIFIDKGTKDGLYQGMGVTSPTGIIGLVTACTQHYSLVMSVLNPDFNLSVRLKDEEYVGNLHWGGLSPTKARVSDIPKHVKLNESDIFITSGYSHYFPVGLEVAKILDFEHAEASNFYDINVLLFADLRKLKYVYVLNHKDLPEIDTLRKWVNE